MTDARETSAHERAAPGPAPLRFALSALAGALLVLACLSLLRSERPERERTPGVSPPLKADATPLELMEPIGAVEHLALFRWLGQCPAEGSFLLRIFDAGDPEAAPLVERELELNYWTPNETERVELTDSLLWRVARLDALGVALDMAEGRAERDPSFARPTTPPSSAETPNEERAEQDVPLETTADEPALDTLFQLALVLEEALGEETAMDTRAAQHAQLLARFEDLARSYEAIHPHPEDTGFLQHTKRRTLVNTLAHAATVITPGSDGRAQALELIHRAQTLDLAPEARVGADLDEDLSVLTADGGALLLLLPGARRISVLCVTGTGSSQDELPLERTYEKTRRRLHTALVAAPGPEREAELEEAASMLASMLLPAGLEDKLRGAPHLTIVGLDLLGYVPFELLPLASGRRIEELSAISYLPALPLAGLLASRRAVRGHAEPRSWPRELGLLLAPTLGPARRETWPELLPILHDREDRDALKSPLRHGQVEVLEGAAADRRGLVRLARNARTLHLLVPAVDADPEGQSPCLLLAETAWDKGLLGARDIAAIAWPPLVRVSICGASGAPSGWNGPAAASFGTALLAAGADVAYLPPRPLDFELARDMTAALHAALFPAPTQADHAPPAEAMRRARAALRRPGDSLLKGLVHTYGLGGIRLR